MHTVKLYEASILPVFLVVTFATPAWLKVSNAETLILSISPGLLVIKKGQQIRYSRLIKLIIHKYEPITIVGSEMKDKSSMYYVYYFSVISYGNKS
jgi:hypothetical protein